MAHAADPWVNEAAEITLADFLDRVLYAEDSLP